MRKSGSRRAYSGPTRRPRSCPANVRRCSSGRPLMTERTRATASPRAETHRVSKSRCTNAVRSSGNPTASRYAAYARLTPQAVGRLIQSQGRGLMSSRQYSPVVGWSLNSMSARPRKPTWRTIRCARGRISGTRAARTTSPSPKSGGTWLSFRDVKAALIPSPDAYRPTEASAEIGPWISSWTITWKPCRRDSRTARPSSSRVRTRTAFSPKIFSNDACPAGADCGRHRSNGFTTAGRPTSAAAARSASSPGKAVRGIGTMPSSER